jgi:hypothetical protein
MAASTADQLEVEPTTSESRGGVLGKLKTLYNAGTYGRSGVSPEFEEATRTIHSGQMTNRFTMMIQVAVTLAVGVLIVGQIFDALPSTTGPLSNASDQVESLTATAFELAPIVLIVVVAALVIGVVRRI